MSFGLSYEQLTPVAGKVRAGIVSYDGNNPEHRTILREALPHFLGSLGAVHGEAFPKHHLDAVIDVINAKEIEVDFFLVALDACSPVLIGGLATGAPTFGAECDSNNNLRIFPVKHGEDLCVDMRIAKLFRDETQSHSHPNGIGPGTWFMREQIRRSMSNPDWVFAGRDNEHSPDNPPILGLMDKFGAIRGTEHDSAVLQLNGLTDAMIGRLRVHVEKQELPSHTDTLKVCPNNFLMRWSSDDSKQQIAVIYTKMASTFDGQPVVWMKIKSNGNLPENKILEQVLTSLLAAGTTEISERKWGTPRKLLVEKDCPIIPALGLPQDIQAALYEANRNGLLINPERTRHVFSPLPVMHIHLNNERQILKALLKLETMYRKFGDHTMLSGVINPRSAPESEKLFGHKLPDATQVNVIDPDRNADKPYFDVAPELNEILHPKVIPIRSYAVGAAAKHKIWSYAAA